MKNFNRKAHWENIYQTRKLDESGWYQEKPVTSLELIDQLKVPLNASIIDIGGGDSYLVDHLLDIGYSDITVLDISGSAIERAKKRLGSRAKLVEWIVSDIVKFKPKRNYDLWHDRAAFHFLTNNEDIQLYLDRVNSHLLPGGHLVIGTFSEAGPTKCSGIIIQQYSENTMSKLLDMLFEKIQCFYVDHVTPSKNVQNFLFCCFQSSKGLIKS
jgi:ubiquinone/menaquinone biosynthesis C-methylase UbiE